MVHGIKETKEALEFGLLVVKIAKDVIKDGKPGLGHLILLPKLISSGLTAVKGSHLIIVEAGDLESEEVDELVEIARPMLEDLTPDELEPVMWQTIASIKQLCEMVGLVK